MTVRCDLFFFLFSSFDTHSAIEEDQQVCTAFKVSNIDTRVG